MARKGWLILKKRKRTKPVTCYSSKLSPSRQCIRCGNQFSSGNNPFETCYKCFNFSNISRRLMESSLYPSMLSACEKSGYTYKKKIPLWVYNRILKWQYAVLWLKILKELRKYN